MKVQSGGSRGATEWSGIDPKSRARQREAGDTDGLNVVVIPVLDTTAVSPISVFSRDYFMQIASRLSTVDAQRRRNPPVRDRDVASR